MATRPIQCVTDSYGRWWYTPPAADGQQVRASIGPFDSRGRAIVHASTEFPGVRIVVDGVTVGASKPPPLPVIDRAQERIRAGLRRDPGPVGAPPAATSPVAIPENKRGASATTSGMEGRQQPAYGEPRAYGQGRRFEEQHGPEAGRLAETVQPSPGAVAESEDPLAASQRAKQSMREAMERARAGI